MTLKELHKRHAYATDKDRAESHTFHGRSYLDCYDEILGQTTASGNILEIGTLFGGSLRLWRDYFQEPAQVIGLDINPEATSYVTGEARIHCEIGSQADIELLKKLGEQYGPFRFIVDDGSHVTDHVLTSFEILWPYVAAGGVYVIEDLRISYYDVDGGWPGMQYNSPASLAPNDRSKFSGVLLQWLRDMDHFRGTIARVDCHPMMCAIKKIKCP